MRSIPILITLLFCISLNLTCLAQEEQVGAEEFDSEEAKAKRLAYVTGHAKALKGTRDTDGAQITPMDKPLLR